MKSREQLLDEFEIIPLVECGRWWNDPTVPLFAPVPGRDDQPEVIGCDELGYFGAYRRDEPA